MVLRRVIMPVCILMLLCISCASLANPGYIEVLTYFFKHYSSNEPATLDFMKKRDGWYICNRSTTPPYNRGNVQMLWDAGSNKYLTVSGFAAPQKLWDDDLQNFVYHPNHINTWVDFERCAYYGYDGWEEDVIKDYEGYKGNNDTVIESLGRAYSSMSEKYLWYQMGGRYTGDDSLLKPVSAATPFPHAKLVMAMEYMDKAIATYARLARKNPEYQTLVGKAPVKYQNEIVNAWNKIEIAGYDEEAKRYLLMAQPDEMRLTIAKNYLNSCPDSAILFTYGDNETYSMWWLQQRQGYRKDVAVITTSLLGTTRYIDLVRRKNPVKTDIKPSQYQDSTQLIYYLMTDGDKAHRTSSTIPELVNAILNREGEPYEETGYRIYYTTSDILSLPFSTPKQSLPDEMRVGHSLPVQLSSFLTLDNLMLLRIINKNMRSRPICFTSDESGLFEQQLIATGYVRQLLPIDTAASRGYTFYKWEAEQLIDYVHHKQLKWELPKTADMSIIGPAIRKFEMLDKIARHYLEMNNKKAASEPINEMRRIAIGLKTDAYTWINTGVILMNASRLPEAKACLETAAHVMTDKYCHPSLLNGYASASRIRGLLDQLKQMLNGANAHSTEIDELLKIIPASN